MTASLIIQDNIRDVKVQQSRINTRESVVQLSATIHHSNLTLTEPHQGVDMSIQFPWTKSWKSIALDILMNQLNLIDPILHQGEDRQSRQSTQSHDTVSTAPNQRWLYRSRFQPIQPFSSLQKRSQIKIMITQKKSLQWGRCVLLCQRRLSKRMRSQVSTLVQNILTGDSSVLRWNANYLILQR